MILEENGPQWYKNEPTDWGIEVFTSAECWVLAYYLHRIGGWHVCVLAADDQDWYWEHVVVQIGDDSFLDVEGVHTRAQLEERWGRQLYPLEVRTFKTWNSYQAYMDGEFEYEQAPRWSRAMAKRLVEKYVQEHALTV